MDLEFTTAMMLISVSFDGHRLDPLADLQSCEDGFRWITEALVGFADQRCQGRIASILEGGYDLAALGRSAILYIEAMMGL